MSDEGEEAEFEFEESQPRAVMFDVPEGQIMIPDLMRLPKPSGTHPWRFGRMKRGFCG
jgi:hypothetical protein